MTLSEFLDDFLASIDGMDQDDFSRPVFVRDQLRDELVEVSNIEVSTSEDEKSIIITF